MFFSELRMCLRADLMRLSKAYNSNKRIGIFFWMRIFHPRFIPVLFIRLSSYFNSRFFLRPFSFLCSLLNVILFGIEVTPRCDIGPGLLIPHTSGTVIGANEIGNNVTIFQGVTLGAKYADIEFEPGSRPVIGDNVIIGAGAKVLGNIRIGRNVVIAANSLLTESVPENSFAIGIPAIIKTRE